MAGRWKRLIVEDDQDRKDRGRLQHAARTARRGARLSLRIGLKSVCLTLLTVLLFFSIIFGYGLSKRDLAILNHFSESVVDWQSHADYRRIGFAYIHESYACMTAHIAGCTATEALMTMRSIPGLPEKLAVNPTSQKHYVDFSRGELSAYLHLCGEQGPGIANVLPMMQSLASRPARSDEEITGFLSTFRLAASIETRSPEAITGVRSLLEDTHAAEGFTSTEPTELAVLPYIKAIAQSRGWPENPDDMSADQQLVIMKELDGYVHDVDRPVWRTKQVTDFLNGVWGECYGQMYRNYAIADLMRAHAIGQWTTWVLLTGVMVWLRASFRKGDKVYPASQGVRIEPGAV